MFAVLLLLTSGAHGEQATSPKRFLVLYWGTKDFPGNVRFDENFQTILKSSPEWTEYYPEYLDIDRFPGETQSRYLHDYLRRKYADVPLDVVVAISDPVLDFLLKYRDDLFPTTPIVFSVNTPPTTEQLAYGVGMTGFFNRNAYRETLNLALGLHPDTEEVFIVSGSLLHDKILENTCRQELASYESRATINYLTDLTPGELTVRLKSLPKQSLVFYLWQQARNEQGRLLETQDVLALVAKSSSAPIYGVASWQVGKGIVGGYVRAMETNGTRAAEMAQKIATGVRPQDIPVQSIPIEPMFDWQELTRWGIGEARLPPGSILRNKQPGFWEQYWGRIIGVLTLFVLQTAFIATLLVERRRRRRAKEALDQLNAELEQRITARTAALDAKSRELETFAYSVAHDLKAPLRGIDGYSRLLLEDHGAELDKEGRSFVATIQSSTEEMNLLIDDLLAYSRLERRDFKPDRLELQPLIAKVVEQKKRETTDREIDFVVDVNGGSVLADANGLIQSLSNYLDNAVKFTRDVPQPRIEVGAKENTTNYLLWVRDNGIGFDSKYHDLIFDIFQRLNPAEDYPGTGIGLAIVRKAMQRMGGKAWAESKPGQGATFYLEIPR